MSSTSEVTVVVDMVFPTQTNHYGTLFGGEALKLMDKAAFIMASRDARQFFVTASIDRTDFKHPVRLGELAEVQARVISRGRSSITVETQLFSETLLTGERILCATAQFVMVAVTAEGRPQALAYAHG